MTLTPAPEHVRAANPRAPILRQLHGGEWIALTTAQAIGHPSGNPVASGILTSDGQHHVRAA